MGERIPSIIDRLPVKSFADNPRRQWKLVGQASALRPALNKDKTDMQRFRAAEKNTKQMKGDDSSDRCNVQFAKTVANKSRIFLGISGSSPHAVEPERGELQGYVHLYPISGGLLSRIRQNLAVQIDHGEPLAGSQAFGTEYLRAILTRIDQAQEDKLPILEVSYAKPKTAIAGQVGSAVRNLMHLVAQAGAGLDEADPGRTEPRLVIFGTTSKRDADSQRVLEHAGFLRIGQAKYDSDDPQADAMYVLDWAEWNRRVHETADRELFGASRQHPSEDSR